MRKFISTLKKLFTGELFDEELDEFIMKHNPSTDEELNALKKAFWLMKARQHGGY